MAISDTLSPKTFADINQALMQTNPDPVSLNVKAGPLFGNDAPVAGVSTGLNFEQ